MCLKLCTSDVAVEITRPFLLKYASQESRVSDPSGFRSACSQRVKWTPFLKWGGVEALNGGSIDFGAHPNLIEALKLRCASYTGYVARHFPMHRPSPKEFMAVTRGLYFLLVKENKALGVGDKQPMESGHSDWNRRWV